jgi:hypothetical protein
MAITSLSDLSAAVAAQVQYSISKASISNALAGGMTSLFRATGQPTQPSIPGAWATPVDSDTGYFTFTNPTNPVETYLTGIGLQMANAGSFMLFDRCGHMGGLSGTNTGAQTVSGSIPASRGLLSDGSDAQWWLEWYTDTGATGVNATITYTNQSDVGSRTCVVALAATMRAGRMLPILPTTAGDVIKSIQSVTLSATTGTAGSFGVTLTRQIANVPTAVTNQISRLGPLDLGFPRIYNDAALFGAVLCSTTSTGLVQGFLRLGQK